MNYSLSNKYKIRIELNDLADLVLYDRIESRGFFIKKIDENLKAVNEFHSLKDIVLNGINLVLKKVV
jgi:hypothetical protein